ncbi:uncharacterized protein LOC6558225 [Drosophila grimshawi]|uniref:GH16425 n=1 Tax=Drosophila grimshawi TaxID=7222 RepID=B4IZV7_DROGR|nr:uncharacterized protein LOC6558225 [Drosophila grimshawi]EDV96729.1 GH16425 [Drosophila grimshawi]
MYEPNCPSDSEEIEIEEIEIVDSNYELMSNKDVKITIGQWVFECHSRFLSTFCELFKDSIRRGITVFNLPKESISADVFDVAYTWMSSNVCYCPRSKFLDLFLAAQYLQAPQLRFNVLAALGEERYFSHLGALSCYAEATKRNINDVANQMLINVGKYFLSLVGTEEYLDLGLEELCNLLKCDFLAVHSEVEVFYAAILWILWNYEQRKIHMRRVLKSLRLEQMPPLVLLNFGERLHEMMPETSDLMFYLLHLAVVIGQKRSNNSPMSQDPLSSRAYIRDPECPYLHLLDERVTEISVEMFTDYINTLPSIFEQFLMRLTFLADMNVAEE